MAEALTRGDLELPDRGGPSTSARAARAGRVPVLAAWLLGWGGVALVLRAVLSDADRGLDVMDESHYLLAAQPWARASSFDGMFGWYLGPLLRLCGNDVARLRIVAALLLVAAAVVCALAVRRAATAWTGDSWAPWVRAAWLPGVTAGALCFYAVFVRTPAYNWFAEVGLLLVTAGLCAAATQPPDGRLPKRTVATAAVPLGAGLAVTAVGKATSALGALAVVAVVIGVLWRRGQIAGRWPRAVVAATVGVLVLWAFGHALLIADPATTLAALRRAAGALASADPNRYTLRGVLGGAVNGWWDVLVGSPGPIVVCAALPLLALLADGSGPNRAVRLALLALPGLVLPGLIAVYAFPGGVPGLALAAGPPAVAALTAFSAGLVATSWRLAGRTAGDGAELRPVVVGGGVLVLALCVPLGTNVQYATQAPAAAGLFVAAAGLLFAAAPLAARGPLLTCLCAGAVVLAAVVVPTTRDVAPYRLAPYDRQVLPRDVVPGAAPLLVDEDTAAWVDGLRAGAAAGGWRRGTPLLDLTWHPASVLVLDGRAPHTLLPAFPGMGTEEASARYALQQEDPLVWRTAWLLVPDQQPSATTDAVTRSVGRSFPRDYEPAAHVTAPYDRQTQTLWRPRGSA